MTDSLNNYDQGINHPDS